MKDKYMDDYRRRIDEISTNARLKEQAHLNYVDKLGSRLGWLNSTSNWLFVLAVSLGFPAVFTTSLLGLVPLALAIMGVLVVWYRSKADIPGEIEMNVWFANRYWSIYQESLNHITPANVGTDWNYGDRVNTISDKYQSIVRDSEAYTSGQKTEVILAFDEERHERQRQSAALGNKYNKHEIKQFM